MYNSLFWSISPQDAVTQEGFLVDIVDDDINSENKFTKAAAAVLLAEGGMQRCSWR